MSDVAAAGGGSSAVAGLLAVVTIFVLINSKPKAYRASVKLECTNYPVADVLEAVVTPVSRLGFDSLDVRAGELFICPQPAFGDPARPPGPGLTGGDVGIDRSKCILLDLGDVVPAGAGAAAAAGGGNSVVLAKLEALQLETAAMRQEMAAIAAAAPQQEHVTSPAVLGSRTLTSLAASTGRAGVFEFSGSLGPSVLDELQLSELQAACTADNETGVVRYITPKLWDILASIADKPPVPPLRRLLVNSEKLGRLDFLDKPVSYDKLQKPDLFVTWEPFIAFASPSGKQGTGEQFIFGSLAHRILQMEGCVPLILEAKKDPLTDTHFGELVSYHSHLPGRVNGVLFNHTHFWLTEASSGHVTRLEKCRWGQPGTLALLKQHFAAVCQPPPLALLLSKLLVDLDLTLAPHIPSSFLGAGSTGRVFSVRRGSGPVQALKVVCSSGPLLNLSKEFSLLESAAASGAPVVPAVVSSLKLYPGEGGGYLLETVGTSVVKQTRDQGWSKLTRDETRRVFDALQRVHAVGIIHGDARLPNVVYVGGSVAWLDLFHAARQPEAFYQHAQEDFRMLAASVLNVKLGALPGSVGAAVASYRPEGGSSQAVADAVWAAQP